MGESYFIKEGEAHFVMFFCLETGKDRLALRLVGFVLGNFLDPHQEVQVHVCALGPRRYADTVDPDLLNGICTASRAMVHIVGCIKFVCPRESHHSPV